MHRAHSDSGPGHKRLKAHLNDDFQHYLPPHAHHEGFAGGRMLSCGDVFWPRRTEIISLLALLIVIYTVVHASGVLFLGDLPALSPLLTLLHVLGL